MPPMRKRSLWVRTPLLLLTLLQLSVPAAASWADARLGEQSGRTHIESHATDVCARVHPAECAFHRVLNAPLARAASIVLRIREGQGVIWTPRGPEQAAAISGVTLPDSRAPPTHS